MPAKNVIKEYVAPAYYHLYNRGVEKRKIFLDDQDYGVFLSYLKEYLSPRDELDLSRKLADTTIPSKERNKILRTLQLNNFNKSLQFIAYCLMPNHFHFLIFQSQENAIDKFMNSMGTRYTMYFNKKYKRVGKLYQGIYKAVLITNENQLLHLTRYIHKQASIELNQPSSYPNYLGINKANWIHPETILPYFSKTIPFLSYEAFVKEKDESDFQPISNLLLED